MQWFHNRSTLTKLLGTFASVCVLMAIVGYMGISTAQSIKAGLDEVGGSVLPSTRSIATAQYNLAKAQRDIRTAVLSHDKASTDAAITKMKGEITLSETAWAGTTSRRCPPRSNS